MDDEFKNELLLAIEESIKGCSIFPSWILDHILPIIERKIEEVKNGSKSSN